MSVIVNAEGPKRCIMAIIGEALGAQEELEGRPFCGAAGNILNTKLHTIGVARQQCYITNLVKVRPEGNDFSIYWKGHQPTEELLKWKKKLLEELDTLETNIILVFGPSDSKIPPIALWALTGQTSISKWRGSILTTTLPSGKVVKVIGTYHPAAILRQWEYNPVVTYDFRKALKESEFKEYIIPQRNLLIEPTWEDVLYFTNSNMMGFTSDIDESTVEGWINNDCSLNEHSSVDVAYDIETSFGSITCVSLAFSPTDSMSIPTTKKYWGSTLRLKDVIKQIQWVLTDNTGLKIAQNASFDIQYLMRLFNILPSKPWFDTMIAQHSCYSEMQKSLAFLTSIYTNEPYYKDDLKVWNADMTDNHKLWNYNARDSAVTFEIKNALDIEMDSLGVRHTYNFMMDLLEPLLFMMLKGVRIDTDKKQEYRDKLIPQLEEKIAHIQTTYGDVNPNSPKQVAALIDRLGLTPIINRKTGKPTTNRKALTKLSAKSPELKEIVSAREEKTLISNFIDIETDLYDGRLRCSFNSTGTETGRLSSSESVFWCGRNLQNFPKKIRDIIIPDEGMIFTEADLMGAEARIVAYLSADDVLIKYLDKIHYYTAKLIWGDEEDEIKRDRKELENQGKDTQTKYYKAKRIRHAGNYKGTWVMLTEQLGCTAAEAKELLHRFNSASPNLANWHKQVEETVKTTRTITTILERKRIFFGRYGESLIREAIAYEPQETVAHILNLGLIKFYNEVCKTHKDVEVLLNVHDSILIQHPPELKEFVYEKLHECLRVDLTIKGRTFFIPIEIKSGINWKELK